MLTEFIAVKTGYIFVQILICIYQSLFTKNHLLKYELLARKI